MPLHPSQPEGVAQVGALRLVLLGLVLALVYLGAAKLGLLLDPVGGFATLVWPPAGIALGALILFGVRLWPGVAIGALLANASAGAPPLIAAGIATGNTLEAVLGAAVLSRIAGFHPSLHRRQDVLAVALAAALCTAVSATVGVASLTWGGIVAPGRFGHTWTAWWLGDAVGILTVTPLILVWATAGVSKLHGKRLVEAAVLALSISVLSWLSFHGEATAPVTSFWRPYMLSPLLIWAVLRFEQRGAVTAILLISGIAVWATAVAHAPFPGMALYLRLQSLQTFMAVITLTFLVLGAVTAERRSAELNAMVARDAAEAASRVETQFLSVMSHELKTPLTGIIGYAHLLTDEIGGPLNRAQQGQVGRIKASAWNLAHIIENILTFARAEAGKDEAHLHDVDAVFVAREAMEMVQLQAGDERVATEFSAPERRVNLRTDPEKLRQILVNLIDNAVKFGDGRPIGLAVEQDGPYVLFHVRDQGPGIPSDQLEEIFRPFTQADQSYTREKGGTGLGLAAARALATLLGGRVSAESALGAGSTFTLRLGGDGNGAPPA